MIEVETVGSAVILAGGESRRLGRPKAFLRVGGREILERVLEATDDFEDTVLAANEPDQYAAAVVRYGWKPDEADASSEDPPSRGAILFRRGARGLRIVTDPVPNQGPVGGLAAGLGAAAECSCWVLSCDLPFVTPALGRLLLLELRDAGRETGPRALIPELEGRDQPLCAAWDARAAPIADRCLSSGRLSVRELLDQIDTRRLSERQLRRVGDPARLLFNVNTPSDLERAQELAALD